MQCVPYSVIIDLCRIPYRVLLSHTPPQCFSASPSIFAAAAGVDVNALKCFGWSSVYAVIAPPRIRRARVAPPARPPSLARFVDTPAATKGGAYAAAPLLLSDVASITAAVVNATNRKTTDPDGRVSRKGVASLIGTYIDDPTCAAEVLRWVCDDGSSIGAALAECVDARPQYVRSLLAMRSEYLMGDLYY